MKKLFLFDMDGTLTAPRKKMKHEIVIHLAALEKNGWDIGVISGSDMDYIEQQCDILFDLSPVNSTAMHFLPCNGTKYYKGFKKVWEYSMAEKLGEKLMNSLMKELIYTQQAFMALYPSLPLTGNFIQTRGSVLNWCPIGRNANDKQRSLWCEKDSLNGIREAFLMRLRKKIDTDDITIKLGGETSFDIYPKGWNKTFPIEKIPFTSYEKVYFAGDRCLKNGNDEELFNYLNKKENCKGIQVSSPTETILVIKETLKTG